jgi:hypothetical protein
LRGLPALEVPCYVQIGLEPVPVFGVMAHQTGVFKILHDILLTLVVMGVDEPFFIFMMLYDFFQDRNGFRGGAFYQAMGHVPH